VDEEQHREVLLSPGQVQVELVLDLVGVVALVVVEVGDDLDFKSLLWGLDRSGFGPSANAGVTNRRGTRSSFGVIRKTS
jgi:hypothetical protein